MRLKFLFASLILIASALTTTVLAIDYLKEISYWDVAEINGVTVGEFSPLPWRFQSYDTNANAGTVEVQDAWVGTWKEVGCKTIHCEISGGYDSWDLTFINPRYFIAYKTQGGHYPLYRFGKMRGEPYNLNTIVSAF